MGSSNSSSIDKRRSVKGGILIKLQKTAFSSNETIEGQIILNLEEPFQGHVLQITLQGFEETHFTYLGYHKIGQRVEVKTIHAKGYNQFVDFTIPVYDFAVGQPSQVFVIHPIQAVIPFQLTVAQKLPSSINYFLDQDNNCSLKYQLVATLLPTEANVRPITGIQEIFIGQTIPTQQLPNSTSSVQEPSCCWCCNPGRIQYNANLNSRQLYPNGQSELDLDIDFSQFSSKVNGLKITLIGDLAIKADNTDKVKHFDLLVKEQEVNVNSVNFKQKVYFQIPMNANLSCMGSLINLTYNLIITPKINSCFVVDDSKPHIIQVVINPTNTLTNDLQYLPQQINVQAPLNWNPIMLQPSLVNYTLDTQAQFMNQQQMGLNVNQSAILQQPAINSQPLMIPIMVDQSQYAVQPISQVQVNQPVIAVQNQQIQSQQYIPAQQYTTNQQTLAYPQQYNYQQPVLETQSIYYQQPNTQPQMINQQQVLAQPQQQIVMQPQIYDQQQQIQPQIAQYQQQTYPMQQQQVIYSQQINAPIMQTIQIQSNQQPMMINQNQPLL